MDFRGNEVRRRPALKAFKPADALRDIETGRTAPRAKLCDTRGESPRQRADGSHPRRIEMRPHVSLDDRQTIGGSAGGILNRRTQILCIHDAFCQRTAPIIRPNDQTV